MQASNKQRQARVDPITIANTLQMTNEQRLLFADRIVGGRNSYGFGADGLVDLEPAMRLAQRVRKEVA
jgi:hypothetical protein